MKLYCETKGEKPFDWNAALDRLEQPDCSLVFKEECTLLSRHWVTCACGNLCAAIPRDCDTGAPFDEKLWTLGDTFSAQITRGDISGARHTLNLIERRSNTLLKNIAVE